MSESELSKKTGKIEKAGKVKEQQGYDEVPERYEIIGGIRYDFLSSPRTRHQKLLTNLHLGFYQA